MDKRFMELQGHVADAVASCWIMLCGQQEGLVRDTFEELMHELQHESLSWRGSNVPILHKVLKSEDALWRMLGTRFGARENPLGVLTFTGESITTTAVKARDRLYVIFPPLVEALEKTIPSLAGVVFKGATAYSA